MKQNDVVLISEDNIPRGKWKLGKIVDTFPGKDGQIHTVRVQTKKGMLNRPVQKLHLLEEYNYEVLHGRCAPLQAAKVQEMQKTRKCQRAETSPQEPNINDYSSLVGEDVQADDYRTRSGRAIRRPRRLMNFKLDASGCGCECVACFSFCVNQIKTAMFVVYLGPYTI